MADQPGAMQMPADVFKQVQLAEIDSPRAAASRTST
jgi:hypothetical protein